MALVDSDGNPLVSSPKTSTWRDLSTSAKAVVVTVSGIIAFLAAAVTNIDKIKDAFTTPEAEIVADDIDAADDTRFPYADVYLRNVGDQTGTITSAEVVVDEIVTTNSSGTHMGLSVSEEYDVFLKLEDKTSLPRTFRIDEVSQVLKAGDADRVRFNYQVEFGDPDAETPDFAIGSIIGLTFRIRLTYNDQLTVETEPISVQNGAMMEFSRLEMGQPNANQTQEMKTKLSKLDSLSGTKTQSLERVVRYAKEMLSQFEQRPGG